MKTYIYTGTSSLISMEGNDVYTISTIRNNYLDVDWIWVVEEAGILRYNNETYEVKKGDTIMALYARYEKDDKKKPIAIVSCPALYENYLKNKEYIETKNNNCNSCD
jgi:hypothetical protein